METVWWLPHRMETKRFLEPIRYDEDVVYHIRNRIYDRDCILENNEVIMSTKKQKKPEYYESYDEFMADYVKFKKGEKKREEKIDQENRRDIEYLRRKFASEKEEF